MRHHKQAFLGVVVILAVLKAPAQAMVGDTGNHPKPAQQMEPVPSVLQQYFKIETSLANDSLDGVAEAGRNISKLVTGDEMKMLPADVAKEADALAQAKDLTAARAAFKALSASLIQYMAGEKSKSNSYYEAYCPMAKASWLQADKQIKNPYMGKSMPGCGEIKRSF